MILTGSQIIMECLLEQGVDTIFGYPGGQIMPLYDALYDYTSDGRIRHILTAHEQGATHAADGYARATGKVGVCFATSGPGATNTVTGIATANIDSSPMVVITGQVPVDSIGRDAFQEVDIIGITLPITKHSFALRRVEEIAPAIREAFQIAASGRPGAVLVDVPKNLMVATCEYEKAAGPSEKFPVPAVRTEKIKRLAELINGAARPVIHAGGGVRIADASAELTKLAHKAHIPVATTLMCLGCFPRKDALSLGIMGMHGERESNLAVQNCDLLISVGARFSDRITGDTSGFAKKSTVVHIDIDRAEVDKNVKADFRVIGDVKDVLAQLLPLVKKQERKEWLASIASWKREIPDGDGRFTPKAIIDTIYGAFGDDCIVATDVGQHQMWTAQHWPFAKPRKLITSGGMGTMGFGLGAAIGAKIGCPDKDVVLITGDGSFRMNMNELITARIQGLAIPVFVIRNGTLGMVRQWQGLFWEKRFSATDLPDVVDYETLPKAFGLSGWRVDNVSDLKGAIKAARATGKAAVIACDVDIDENVWPIVPPGDSIENQRMEE
ncbi:MAG: biosynthetic-type acetolactate synthase large subunit [Clostridiales Family XIII bacterium]|jgi:acetolactate synthase-1/2/3 large subunit|nr:biosynthetic-type acetolactate synthase large subunit [Clostridiales Family XIII bacterium]